VPNRNGAVTSAVLVHLRVEPAHFDWRWRERPALALLAWEAVARDPLARLRRIQVESIRTTIDFRPAAITHRDIAVSALPIECSADRSPTETPPDRRRGGQSFGIRSWTGDESISRNPSGVPILDSCTAHGAFKAADLARLYDMFAAVINRAAFTGPMTGFQHAPICASDRPLSS
jgi:hypothetical protein